MNKLSLNEIRRMLKDRCPSEIMDQEGDRLDEAGLRLLGRDTAALEEVDALLASFGKSSQEEFSPENELNLADPFPEDNLTWFQGETRIPNKWLLLAASALVTFMLLLSREQPNLQSRPVDARLSEEPGPSLPMVSKGTGIFDQGGPDAFDQEKYDALQQELFRMQLDLGAIYLNLGSNNNDTQILQKSLRAFEAAYLINPKDQGLLLYLSKVHEQLGHEDQARSFLEKSTHL